MCRRQHRVFLSNVVSLLTKKYDYVLLYERMLYFTRELTFEWKQKKQALLDILTITYNLDQMPGENKQWSNNLQIERLFSSAFFEGPLHFAF